MELRFTLFVPLLLSAVVGTDLSAATWAEATRPVISIGNAVPYMLWNDPTVISSGTGYRMWLSGGDLRNLNEIVVKVYTATSQDGLSWSINATPCVSPSDPSAWDGLRIETPSVVKVGNVYHMYYSGTNAANAVVGVYGIGHATSRDGVSWTKDPANPILTGQTVSRFQWGYGGVGEPGVVYNSLDRTFYLYYSAMKFSSDGMNHGLLGILLSKSQDGTHFTNVSDTSGDRMVVLTRDVPGASAGSWFGYTGVSGYIGADHNFHLFCTFLVAPIGQTSARDVGLAHAVSADGEHFSVVESDLFPAGQGNWRDQNVRSPSPLEINGVLKLWFAGDTQTPYFSSSIGFASRPAAN